MVHRRLRGRLHPRGGVARLGLTNLVNPEKVVFTSLLILSPEQLADRAVCEAAITLAAAHLRAAVLESCRTFAPQAAAKIHDCCCAQRRAGMSFPTATRAPSTVTGQIQAALDEFSTRTGRIPKLAILPVALFGVYEREKNQIARAAPADTDARLEGNDGPNEGLFTEVGIFPSESIAKIEVH